MVSWVGYGVAFLCGLAISDITRDVKDGRFPRESALVAELIICLVAVLAGFGVSYLLQSNGYCLPVSADK